LRGTPMATSGADRSPPVLAISLEANSMSCNGEQICCSAVRARRWLVTTYLWKIGIQPLARTYW
jgi:hypothetical protein